MLPNEIIIGQFIISLDWLSNPFIKIGLFIILFFIVFIIIISITKRILRRIVSISSSFQKVVLSITVPKVLGDKDEQQQKKELKEQLAPMETLLENLGGLKAQHGWRAKLLGRTDYFSFEIVLNQQGKICFYVVVPKYLQQFTEEQIHAQFPAAQIESVNDYNIFVSQGVNKAAYLGLLKKYIFPVNTYLKSNNDFLNAILSSLTKIQAGNGAAIQIVAGSSRGEWHQYPARVASAMQQGKKLSEAIAEVGGKNIFTSIFKSVKEATQTKSQENLNQTPKTHQLSPMEQETIKALEEKTSKAGLDVNIRIVVSAQNDILAQQYLDNIINSFSQFSKYQYGNGFKAVKLNKAKKVIEDFIYRCYDSSIGYVLNTEELTTLYHFPLSTTNIPNIDWLLFKKSPPPLNISTEGLILGKNIYRDKETLIRIKQSDRRRHFYMIGKTGTGKSWAMSAMAVQDILAGRGVCLVDPHGDLIEEYILPFIPKERAEDVIYFNPADLERPLGLNLLEYDPKYPEQKTMLINEMINIMDKLYDLRQTGGPMFEQYMRNALLLIMEHPESGSTLMEVSRVLADEDFRHFKIEHSNNQIVNDFWSKQAEKAGGEAALANMVPYITSKLTQFVANDLMRPIIGQQKSAFNIRQAMDDKKILLVNLSKGKIGDINAYLLGLIIIGKILVAALSRTDLPEDKRNDFYLYIDEFQNFITESINTILAEARKYRLNLIVAHQYISQLVKDNNTQTRDAIFGNVGTIMSFRVGVEDAEFLAKEMAPVFNQYDLNNVEKYNSFIKLLIDNQSATPFNIQTISPDETASLINLPPKDMVLAEKIRQLSRLKYGRDRKVVEAEIKERSKVGGKLDLSDLLEDYDDDDDDEEENKRNIKSEKDESGEKVEKENKKEDK